MHYREVAPHRKLRGLIKCFWTLDHDYSDSFHDHEQLWADAHTELIFSWGSAYFRKVRSRIIQVPVNFVIGPFQHDLQLYSRGRTALVAARFWPWGFHSLSKLAMPALKNTVSSWSACLGAAVDSLGDHLAGIENLDGKIAAMEQSMLNAIQTIRVPGLHSRPMARDILDARGIIRAGELARKHHIHPRRMERLFLEEIGVSAKVLARIVRFNHARQTIERNPGVDFLWLAHECGYSDQSHFTRNFREMFGVTPSAFKSRVSELLRVFQQQRPDVVFLQDSDAEDG